jgi:hypothetical protein
VADELRAKIYIMHVIKSSAGSKLKVNKTEEKETLPEINFFKQKVTKYGFQNNCEMLTGHILAKGGVEDNVAASVKKNQPYAVILNGGNLNKLSEIISPTVAKILKQVNIPVMLIPDYANYEGIKNIGYFTDVTPTRNTLNDLIQLAGIFKAKIFMYCLQTKAGASTIETLRNEYREAIKYNLLQFGELDKENLITRISSIAEEHTIHIAVFNAEDSVYAELIKPEFATKSFLIKTPVFIYPGM